MNGSEPKESKFSRWFRPDTSETQPPVTDVKEQQSASTKDFFNAFLRGNLLLSYSLVTGLLLFFVSK